eukprot:gene3496-3995_t
MINLRNNKVLSGHQGSVMVVKFNATGSYCLSGSQDKTIKLWNPEKQLLIHTFNAHGYQIIDVVSSSDSTMIFSCAERQLYQWDIGTGEVVRRFKGHPQDNSLLVSGSYDKSIKIWDLRSRNYEAIQSMEEAQDSVTSVYVNDQEYEIISSSVDGSIRTYDIRNGRVTTDQLHRVISSVATHPSNSSVVSSSTDGSVRFWHQ